MGQKSFTWKSTTLFSSLKNFDERANKAIGAAFEYQATRSEQFMKTTAPWQDDTGNARNGLFTAVEHQDTTHRMLLSHGVDYGVWLEVRFNGRYAVVHPAWLTASVELWALLNKLFSRMDGGGG